MMKKIKQSDTTITCSPRYTVHTEIPLKFVYFQV